MRCHGRKFNHLVYRNILVCSAYKNLWKFLTIIWVVFVLSGQIYGKSLVNILTRYGLISLAWNLNLEQFIQVCCHHNPHVGFFALDALRQLAMRFLEKEELPHFKFQKDFLKPFEYTMIHNKNPDIRVMVGPTLIAR